MPRTRKKYVAPVDEKTIGNRLREVRKQRGLTQAEVAGALHIKQTLVSEYERGTVRIHGALLAAFAKILEVSADELLCLSKPKQNGAVHDRRVLRVVREIEALPRRDKDALLKTINNFLRGARAR
jgi:transcriptional regulator with XRE-family HTH domain